MHSEKLLVRLDSGPEPSYSVLKSARDGFMAAMVAMARFSFFVFSNSEHKFEWI